MDNFLKHYLQRRKKERVIEEVHDDDVENEDDFIKSLSINKKDEEHDDAQIEKVLKVQKDSNDDDDTVEVKK